MHCECVLTFVNANAGVYFSPIHLHGMNTPSLRRLFLLAVAAGIGLLCLQMFWLHNEWQNTTDVLQRQVDYSFQSAVDSEQAKRRDILRGYLEKILSDTSLIGINTRYNEKEGKWMINMYDARNQKDYSSWTNAKIPVGPELTAQQKTAIIKDYVQSNINKNIESDVIFFYTQRFGNLWSAKYATLKLDSVYLEKIFRRQLDDKNINTNFTIAYIDTTVVRNMPAAGSNAFTARAVGVNYSSVNDYNKKYIAVAKVYSPIALLFKRLYIAFFATVLLLALTLFCLYRMYKTILQQKQLNELKNDFIGNMTHELKTPIATVTAAIDGLQYFNGLNDKEKAERYLNTSRNELQRLNDIVSKVLDISIYERQLTTLHKEAVGIGQLFKTVIQSFEVKGNTFNYEVECSPQDLTVMADKMHLQNVLYNLVDNAIKYVPANLQLMLSAYKQNDNVVISIADNGSGIDDRHLPLLFDKFYRIPNGNVQNVKGFGLGLFYVKQVIQQHGGNVYVHSSRNKGTTFTLIL